MGNAKRYRETLNLPRTDFPMRANLPQREPQFLQRWKEMRLYEKSLALRQGAPRFELHDGPPYSNLHIHCGHMLNKVLKDIVVRYAHMKGHYAPFVPGWDNHGLPIEYQVSEALKEEGRQVDALTLRQECRRYAAKWVAIQSEEFQRLGVRGDWEHPYLTMDPEFEARIVEVFAQLALQGYVYRGLRVIHWCPYCTTALAEAEIEYAEKTSPSIYVAFPVLEDSKGFFTDEGHVIIWTTTPWTIPANLAIAVHPDFHYAIFAHRGKEYLVARELLGAVQQALGWEEVEVRRTVVGKELEGLRCRHPLYERPSVLVLAEYVDLEMGTGCVHTAPGHGKEDFETAQRYGLGVLSPVDAEGRFTEEVGPRLAGRQVFEANAAVNAWLREVGALLQEGEIRHTYPHCWRCHNPVIFRATVQWFMNVDHPLPEGKTHRERCLEEIEKVRWVPSEGKNRIKAMVSARPDWCLSRQRAWGVGIPVFYCSSCGEAILSRESLQAAARLVREEGSDAWFQRSAAEILPSGFTCPRCGGTSFTKEEDILDVWFDSGSTHQVLYGPQERPVDVYLEGSDQHRGWFNSSLMIGVGMDRRAPYRIVITHGFVLDSQGRAMHKSLGNVISPLDLIRDYGADVLRLWVMSVNFAEDVRIGDEILQRVAEAYRSIRNTFRFLLGNLYDFDPQREAVPYEHLTPLDRWALHELERLKERARQAYEEFQYHLLYHAVINFCENTLSALYLNILKDRLYCSAPTSPLRRAAQTVLYELTHTLARILAPVLVFTTEEVWDHLPGEKAESVHLTDFPTPQPQWRDEGLAQDFERFLRWREEVNKAIEAKVQAKELRQSLEAAVTLRLAPAEARLAQRYGTEFLKDWLVVSAVAVEEKSWGEAEVEVRRAEGAKCERCWVYSPTVGRSPEHPDLCARCVGVMHELAVV